MFNKRRIKHPKMNKEILGEKDYAKSVSDISTSNGEEKPDIPDRKKRKKDATHKPRRESFGFLMVVGIPLSWSVVTGLISTTEFQRHYFGNLLQVFLIVGILGLVFIHRYAIRAALGVLFGFILFTLVGFFWISEPPSIANEFATLLANTFRYVIGIESHTRAYESVAVWIISIAICLFVVFFTYYRFVFIVLFSVLSVFFTLMITSVYFSYPLSFFVFIICILVLLVRHMHQRSSDSVTRKSPYVWWIIPVTVICFFLMGFAPIPGTGTMQGPVRTAIMRPINFINDAFFNMTSRREFSIRQVGFGGVGGRLGGAAVTNHEVFMRISTDADLPLYLTGATSDTYTGYAWENAFVDVNLVDFSLLEQNLELLERFINFDVIQSPLITEYFRIVSEGMDLGLIEGEVGHFDIHSPIEIMEEWTIGPLQLGAPYKRLEVDVLHFRPSFIFYSGVLQGIATDDQSIAFVRDREGKVTINNRSRFQRNSRYEVLSFRINQLPGVQTLPPRHTYSGLLAEFAYYWERYSVGQVFYAEGIMLDVRNSLVINLHLGEEIHTISIQDLLNNYLIPRRDRIYQTYTQLPEDFPTRINELAMDITEGALSNYHMMVMLEDYLSQNFTYTLTPVNPPLDQDFVYHFLFDTGEGHCVYFATAFVTMARSLGMPARYTEGFVVNGVPNEEGQINVLNSMAHAWPEVYFEGYGWHPFEPTPASGLPQLRAIPEGASYEWNPWMDPEFMGDTWPSYTGPLEGIGPGSGQESTVGSGREAGLGGIEIDLGFWAIVGWSLSALLILIIIRVLWVYLLNIGWRRKENEGAVIYAFGSILLYLKLFNYQMKDGETAFRFMKRVCNKAFLTNADEKKQLEKTVEIYGKARYSDLEISREERMLVEKTVKNLDNRTKSHLGYPKYYFYRYILASTTFHK